MLRSLMLEETYLNFATSMATYLFESFKVKVAEFNDVSRLVTQDFP